LLGGAITVLAVGALFLAFLVGRGLWNGITRDLRRKLPPFLGSGAFVGLIAAAAQPSLVTALLWAIGGGLVLPVLFDLFTF